MASIWFLSVKPRPEKQSVSVFLIQTSGFSVTGAPVIRRDALYLTHSHLEVLHHILGLTDSRTEKMREMVDLIVGGGGILASLPAI